MSAKYTMQEIKPVNNPEHTVLYPKMIIRNCCDGNMLAELVAGGSTFHKGEVMGMMNQLVREIAGQLARGNSVKIDELGVFTPSLSLKEGKMREATDGNGTRRNAQSVKVGGVNFRPDRALLDDLNRHCRLERESKCFRLHHSCYTVEERLALACRYLDAHPFLTVSEYARLAGLGKTVAGKELRAWSGCASSGIDSRGKGSHKVYVKAVPVPSS